MRKVFLARGIDYRTRRVTLYDNSNRVVAANDLDRCRDWQWDHDQIYVYDVDHHPAWYLLFNARPGRNVHVEYLGVHWKDQAKSFCSAPDRAFDGTGLVFGLPEGSYAGLPRIRFAHWP